MCFQKHTTKRKIFPVYPNYWIFCRISDLNYFNIKKMKKEAKMKENFTALHQQEKRHKIDDKIEHSEEWKAIHFWQSKYISLLFTFLIFSYIDYDFLSLKENGKNLDAFSIPNYIQCNNFAIDNYAYTVHTNTICCQWNTIL